MATARTKQLAVTLTHERDTKNKRRYQEDGDEAQHVIGTLYLAKDRIATIDNPDELEVIVRAKK